MASSIVDRKEPSVVRAHAPAVRSRLPSVLRIPILVVLNLGINAALWSFASNFLLPELGRVSKVPPREEDIFSLYSPIARIAMRVLTTWTTWYLSYDFQDVSALTVLTQAPYVYVLATYYGISNYTILAHVTIEVLSYAIPTYLLRPRSIVHRSNAPLRNRFLLNSVQVQVSSALLAMAVYVSMLWGALKIGSLNRHMVSHFEIDTIDLAYAETPVSILGKVFVAGIAAKAFLLNPSIAAQPLSGAETPTSDFNPATSDLQQTVMANVWYFSKRTRTLIQQTTILNTILFANTVQRCLTLTGSDFTGAAGYAFYWLVANTVLGLWFAWVGDTSSDYEPL